MINIINTLIVTLLPHRSLSSTTTTHWIGTRAEDGDRLAQNHRLYSSIMSIISIIICFYS